jgi:DNA-binding SARP family transcriptional activator/tetratricopeptide (TPR) repeat protein
VELETRRIERDLSGRQGRELFAYLVLNRSRLVSRDELVALLWPEQPPRAPEAALNTILARLRRALGQSVLSGRGQLELELPPNSWVDVEAAEEAASAAETLLGEARPADALEAARAGLDILAAELLPEVQHTWVDQPRRELEDVCTQLLTAAVRCGLALGGTALDDAERAAKRVVDREPFRETSYAMLMEVHAARGDIAEALLVYERLRALLKDELGIPPSARIASLHQSLLCAEPANGSTPVGSVAQDESAAQERPPPIPELLAQGSSKRLVGRSNELDVLRAAWSGVLRGERGVLALAGEPGIGKTMLSAWFAREVHTQGAIVLYGQADEEALVPYAPVVSALRHYVKHTPGFRRAPTLAAHVGELGWLIPELSDFRAEQRDQTGDARLERLRLYQGMAASVAHAASRRPVLLVLEDLQWADSDTLLVIRQLLREATQQPLLSVLTYRDSEVGAHDPLARLLTELRRDLEVTRVTLAGLEDDGIAELLSESEHEDSTPELVRHLREHTSGNPFFIEEVARSLQETAPANGYPDRPRDGWPVLPDAVQDVVQDRLRRLTQPTRDALAAAAILGQDFSAEWVASVLGDDRAAHALDAAVGAGMIVEQGQAGDRYRFCHALAREAIYRSIGRSRRAELHYDAARALERCRRTTPVDAARLAHHFVESHRADVAEEAVDYSRQAAATALASHAYDDAVRHYRRAIEVLDRFRPSDAAARCEVLLKLGEASWQASGPSAREIFEQAAAVARRFQGHSQLAAATLGLGGRFYAPTTPDRPYIQLLEEALLLVGDDDQLRARVQGRLAEHLMLVDAARAARLGQDALATARLLEDQALLAVTMLSQHTALLHVDHLSERTLLAREQVTLARRCGERELEALGTHWLLYDLLEAGDVVAAVEAYARLEQLANELEQRLYRHSALVWKRVIEQIGGRFERAGQLAHEALNIAEGAHGPGARTHYLAQQLAVVRDRGRAEKLLPAVRRQAAGGETIWLSAVDLLEADCAECSVPLQGSEVLATERLPDLHRDVFWLVTLAWLAESAAHTDDHERSEVLYELLAPSADRWVQFSFNGSFGSVHRYLGLLAAQLGRGHDAAEHFDEAVRRHVEARAPALEARALCDFGEAILAGRATGSARDASTMLERAGGAAEACDATRLRERTEALERVPAPA